MGVTDEAGKAVGGVITALGTSPLLLSMVVMNLVLLGFLFYVQSSTNKQRQETVNLIVAQQSDTEKLLASCVSSDVTRTMLDHMQKITDTMLAAEQKEIQRMQDVVSAERQRSWELREREKNELDELKKQQPPHEQTPRAQRLSTT